VLDVSADRLLRSAFHTLAYADIFEYPLTAEEVYRYLTSVEASPADINKVLATHVLFSQVGKYFTLRGREYIVQTRRRRAEIASKVWPKAARYARMIAALPFVRMVAVTGSLAMNNAEEGKDVDFMIVTAANRLWTVRALCLLVARLAKLEDLNLCPNYLVTTNALELKERSLYVAHELAQMLPLSGIATYQKMRQLNNWTEDYLPHAASAPALPSGVKYAQKDSPIKRIVEVLFRLPFANWLEKWEMGRKIARLSREQASSFESCFSADVCKGHIDRHAENVETALAVRIQAATRAAGMEAA
jgi:hypothetical protein